MFADIHTHILHCIDDGSSSVDESLELLKREKDQGVCHIALTPHFDMEQVSLDDFLRLREKRYNELIGALQNKSELEGLQLHLGAEVAYSPNLINTDVEKLLIGGTNYILLELPIMQPFNIEETLKFLFSKGIVPIFAHIERYSYLNSRCRLSHYKKQGVIMQSNVSTLLHKSTERFVRRMIKKGYIDILASDTHNINTRTPKWKNALRTLDIKQIEKIKNNTLMLFSDIAEEQNM